MTATDLMKRFLMHFPHSLAGGSITVDLGEGWTLRMLPASMPGDFSLRLFAGTREVQFFGVAGTPEKVMEFIVTAAVAYGRADNRRTVLAALGLEETW